MSVQDDEEAETGLRWMWAGLSCFLSSGDRYVGELLELHGQSISTSATVLPMNIQG